MGRSSLFFSARQQPESGDGENKPFEESMRRFSDSRTKEDCLQSGFRSCLVRGTSSWAESIEAETEESSSSSQGSDNESPNTVMWGSRPPGRTTTNKMHHHRRAPERHAAPSTATAPSRSIPVRRRRVEDPDQESLDEMTRLYDMRTWEMYMRITEARKKTSSPAAAASISQHSSFTRPQQQPSRNNAALGSKLTPISNEENDENQEDDTDPELFFGDLDDW